MSNGEWAVIGDTSGGGCGLIAVEVGTNWGGGVGTVGMGEWRFQEGEMDWKECRRGKEMLVGVA